MAKKKKVVHNKEREPLLYIGVGKKGVGKTYNTIQIIDNYVKGNKKMGTIPRRALIIDVNNEYTQYKAIDPNDIVRFTRHPKIEARRIVPLYRNGSPMSLNDLELIFKYAASYFRSGLLLVEDITKFVGDAIPDDIVGNICTNRHRDVDIVAHFQSVGKAGHPKIKANMNMLRLHKTSDSVLRHKTKFAEYYDIVKIAEMLVDKRYDQFIKENPALTRTYFTFFVYIDFDRNKILGNFGRNEFQEIITDFIQDNEKSLLNPTLNKKDRQGNKLFNYTEALVKTEQDLFDRYAQPVFPF
jgi:ribosomal protein L30/L7E